jgi:MFS family permease
VIRLSFAIFLAIIGFHAYVASLPVALHAGGWSDPEIGVVMGASAAVQIAAAFVAGALIDRCGGRLVFLVGTAAFALASLAFLADIASSTAPLPVLLAVRLLQGIGMATALPSGLSLVPALVEPRHLGLALSVAGSASNVALAAAPPISLALLDAGSLRLVAGVTLICVAVGAAIMWGSARPRAAEIGSGVARDRGVRELAESRERPGGPRLRAGLRGAGAFRPAYRSSWTMPLLITFLFIVHWGVVTAYLPQRAETGGADIGLFYTIDAVAILALRIPMGHLTDRVGPRPLLVAGMGITAAAVLLLLLPPDTPTLALAGLGTGIGGALAIPAVTVELAHRSGERDRGSAFSLYSAAFAGGIALGSLGGAPIVGTLGFEFAAAAGALMCLVGLVASLFLRPVTGGYFDLDTGSAVAGP